MLSSSLSSVSCAGVASSQRRTWAVRAAKRRAADGDTPFMVRVARKSFLGARIDMPVTCHSPNRRHVGEQLAETEGSEYQWVAAATVGYSRLGSRTALTGYQMQE